HNHWKISAGKFQRLRSDIRGCNIQRSQNTPLNTYSVYEGVEAIDHLSEMNRPYRHKQSINQQSQLSLY
ncbi:hypothetical protein ACJBZI_11440, partial [Streptococcus suis]